MDERGKATVTRIFMMYRKGMSLESIARTLNVEREPPPRAKTKHRRKGWVASTIRDILRNRPEETVERALLFEKMLADDPVAGREELRRLFEGGKVLCRPQPDGFYVAEGKLYPLALFSMRLEAGTPKARDFRESAGLGGMNRGLGAPCSINGCAGAIHPLDHVFLQDFRVHLTG